MRIDKAIRDFLIEIEIRKYTPKTIRSYRNNLSLFLRFCEEKAGIEYTEDISLPVIKQLCGSGVRTKSWTKQRPQGGSRYIVHIRKESPRPAII